MSKWKPAQTKDAQAVTWFYGDIPFNDGKPDTKAEEAAMLAGYEAGREAIVGADLTDIEAMGVVLLRWMERAELAEMELARAREWAAASHRLALDGEERIAELEARLVARPTINLWDRLRRLFR